MMLFNHDIIWLISDDYLGHVDSIRFSYEKQRNYDAES